MATNLEVTLKRHNGVDVDNLYPSTVWAQIVDKPSTFTPTSHSHGTIDNNGMLVSQGSPSISSGYLTNVGGVLYWGDGSARTILHSSNWGNYCQPDILKSTLGANATSSSTTLADTALTITLLAGKTYIVRFYGMAYGAATTTGLSLGIRMTDVSGAGAPTVMGQFWSQSTAAISASTVFVGYLYAAAIAYTTAGTSAIFTTSVTSTVGTPHSMECIITTGSANRTIYIGLGSEVGASLVTLKSGAVLYAIEI